jgi:predicted O-methyltransferase YrrM
MVTDLGAGSKINSSNKRTVASIAITAEKSPRLAQLIFSLIEYLKPKVIIDLGTSLGLTTIYEALANKGSEVYTFEGCPETSRIALENFKKLKIQNIELIEGNIDQTLENQLKQLSKIDFVFFDANHRYEPTIRYFNLCFTKAHEETCFVFDDIHWSDEMDQAWQEIIKDERVTVSIDLFYLGIVFFRKKQPKEHFILRH